MLKDSALVVGQYPDDTWMNPNTKGGTASCLRNAQKYGLKIMVRDFRY